MAKKKSTLKSAKKLKKEVPETNSKKVSKATLVKKKQSKIGRPSIYSEALAQKICDAISTSSKGLVTICKSKGMPSVRSVLNWLSNPLYADFLHMYTRAREEQAEYLADEIIAIADTCRKGIKTVRKDGGVEITEEDMIARSRLMVDARKWKASKLAPKKYGDKVELTGKVETGEEIDYTKLSDDVLKAIAEAVATKSPS